MKINETKRVVQIGILTDDIKNATKLWTKILRLEEEPEIVVSETFNDVFRGKPTSGKFYNVLFNFMNIQIELMEPIGDDLSTWRECLDQHGPQIHHFAFQVEDAEADIQEFESLGIPVVQRGDMVGDGVYAYLDGREKLGAIVEFLQLPIDMTLMYKDEDDYE